MLSGVTGACACACACACVCVCVCECEPTRIEVIESTESTRDRTMTDREMTCILHLMIITGPSARWNWLPMISVDLFSVCDFPSGQVSAVNSSFRVLDAPWSVHKLSAVDDGKI